jgi:hypothetical protein
VEISQFFFSTNFFVIWNWEIPGKFCFSSAILTELSKCFRRNFWSHKIDPKKTLVEMGDLEAMSFASSCISRLQKLSTAQYTLLSPGVGNLCIVNYEFRFDMFLWSLGGMTINIVVGCGQFFSHKWKKAMNPRNSTLWLQTQASSSSSFIISSSNSSNANVVSFHS